MGVTTKLKNNEPITAALIGCGERGLNAYGRYALKNPSRLKFVACADPNPLKRQIFAKLHHIPPHLTFSSDTDLLNAGKLADAIFICTLDQFHEKEVLPALDLGYHIFLEKPMTTTEEGCRKIVAQAENSGKILAVGHVLRYAPLFQKVKEILNSGMIGEVVNIKHSENMATWVYAHSFVRGNWENSKKTSSLLLQKGVHDFDLIYWFAGTLPARVSMFAKPSNLNAAHAPTDAPLRCTDGCPHEETCIYEARRFYMQAKWILQDNARSEKFWIRRIFKLILKHPKLARFLSYSLFHFLKTYKVFPWRTWPVDEQLTTDLSDEGILQAIQEGPYGRCVYYCNNDQPVSYITNIQFTNDLTATYTLHGMSYRDGRELRIDGTKGSLKANFYNTGFFLETYDHLTGSTRKWKVPLEKVPGGGGDLYIIDGFLDAIHGIAPPLTPAQESLISHLIVFAAERSFKNGTIEKIKV